MKPSLPHLTASEMETSLLLHDPNCRISPRPANYQKAWVAQCPMQASFDAVEKRELFSVVLRNANLMRRRWSVCDLGSYNELAGEYELGMHPGEACTADQPTIPGRRKPQSLARPNALSMNIRTICYVVLGNSMRWSFSYWFNRLPLRTL